MGRRRREPLHQQLEGANGCLHMVRARLEKLGLPMNGCPPMFYDDAIAQLASILGRKAGLKTWDDIRATVAEHEVALDGLRGKAAH